MSLGKHAVLVIAGLLAVAVCITLYIRFTRTPTNVAYVSEEDGGISVIDLNTLKVVKRVHPKNVAPRGLAVTFDGNYLFTANKDTADATVFKTRGLSLLKRIPVGDNPEFVKIGPSGKWIYTSFEPGSSGGPPTEGPGGEEEDSNENEPPAQIVSFNTGDWSRGKSFTAGRETEGIAFSADGEQLVVANEAQNTLGVYDIETGALSKEVNLVSYGRRPRGVKLAPQGDRYAVTMEGSGTLLLMDQKFNVLKSVSTAAKPYGVAFDRLGKRIFVAAAAAHEFQVYSADSLQLLGETPVGKRCWHFTFTPDDSKILLACGRSDNVYVIDANSYKTITTIGGFHTPWGILTYPRSYGSLGLP